MLGKDQKKKKFSTFSTILHSGVYGPTVKMSLAALMELSFVLTTELTKLL